MNLSTFAPPIPSTPADPNVALGACDAWDRANVALGACDAPNVALGAWDAANVALGRSVAVAVAGRARGGMGDER